jgi:hypothetical protein
MKCCSSSRRCPGHNRSADERDRRRRRFRHSVLGAGVQNPADALSITRRALELGFETTVGVIHDHGGQLLPLQGKEKLFTIKYKVSGSQPSGHLPTTNSSTRTWRWVSQTTGSAGREVAIFTSAKMGCSLVFPATGIPCDPAGAVHRRGPCAPYCTISCVHRVAMIDLVREKTREALASFFPSAEPGGPARLPLGVKLLSSIFLPAENGKPQSAAAKATAGAVMRLLGIK